MRRHLALGLPLLGLAASARADPNCVTVEVITTTYLEFPPCHVVKHCPTTTQAYHTLTLPGTQGSTETKQPDCEGCPGTVFCYEPTDAHFVTVTTVHAGPEPTVSVVEPDCHVCDGTVYIFDPAPTGCPFPEIEPGLQFAEVSLPPLSPRRS